MGFVYSHAVLGTPLAEVFSVTIKPDGAGCQVYGTIQAKDEFGMEYLYNRTSEYAESINMDGNNISLSFPDRTLSAAAEFTVVFDLKDKNGDVEFIKGLFTWDPSNSTSFYDTPLSHDFKGKLGLATMHFTLVSVAVDATYVMVIDKGIGSSGTDVFGSIVAHYGSNLNYLDGKDLKDFSLILFNKTPAEAVALKDGDVIPFSRSFSVVPSYSSLVIEVDLFYINSDGQKEGIVNAVVEFPVRHNDYREMSIEKNGVLFTAGIEWRLAYEFQRNPTLKLSRIGKVQCTGYTILEVYSVRIVLNHMDVGGLEVHGIFRADDGSDVFLYNCEKNDSKPVLADSTLALTGPSYAIRGLCFDLIASLWERNQDLVICNNALWGFTPCSGFEWFDWRMSAVLPGKDGYAVLNFTIFEDAVQAKLEVTLSGGGNATIHGSLVAYYSNYEYKSDYLKKYYRTKLLDISEDMAIEVKVKPASALLDVQEVKPEELALEVPLSRDVVAVPVISPLIIEANLSCSTSKINGYVTIPAKPSGSDTVYIAGDKGYVLNFKVSWCNSPFKTPNKVPVETKRRYSDEASSDMKCSSADGSSGMRCLSEGASFEKKNRLT